uniref:Uncharacterized protein n=1 Tax=Triticum urartu TaxID=4572 RepID=A0A8R7TV31_TRIUA
MPSPPPQIASPPRETMSREASGASVSSVPVPEPERQQGQGNQGEEAGWTPLEKVADKVEELYSLRDTFFPRDPSEKSASLRACADAALGVLDSLPPGLMAGVDRDAMERGAKMLKTNAATMMRICAAPAEPTMD